MSLAEYLAASARTPFAWGSADCCTFAADWVTARTGRDPMAQLRGRYRSRLGAARLIRRGGGLVRLWVEALGFGEAGLEQGDIGLIEVGGGLVGAIRTGIGWAMKDVDGGVVVLPEVVASVTWRV